MSLSMLCVRELRALLLRALEVNRLPEAVAEIDPEIVPHLARHWAMVARDDQFPPKGDWSIWMMLGGRGAGKTRAGAEWVRAIALGLPPFADNPVGRIALVGGTFAEVRDVMIEGVSGILSVCADDERPLWQKTRQRLVWKNGAIAQAFSAEDPDSLRGPQFAAAWCDELAKWREADAAWDMLQFGLRLGDRPREMVTTTPRPTALVKSLLSDKRVVVTRATTRANAAHLAPAFLETIVSRYAGTRLGRQELMGELIEDREDALFNRAAIEKARVLPPPAYSRIVVAVDPPAASHRRADRCGLVVAGLDEAGIVYVIEDASRAAMRPAEWAEAAIGLYRRHMADALVVEVNQGGEMVEAVLKAADPSVPVTPVRATRGKYLRAEPVAQAFEQGRVKLAGAFPELEDEMCDFGPGGLSNGRSPDRLDAFVWAVSALLAPLRRARVRRL